MVTRPQFKNSLKTLATIKGGKVTGEQKKALDNVVGYVRRFLAPSIESGLLYLNSTTEDSFCFQLGGAHIRLVDMIAETIIRDEDTANLLLEAFEMATGSGEKEAKIKNIDRN